ncbi:MAG: glycine cleavage T C-terminal barrel domain-containing protein, partial [SAR324 cluster bacterium]|nr:glycine cleavage T C-terminal barrel domain-containing protein [SAR324 cluster bacterium]
GHSVGKSLALAYVKSGNGDIGTELEIEILGERRPARVIPESPCDPDNLKLRA